MRAEELPRVRIAVLGGDNVGKSALTVRFLTRRYIGEYRSKTDLLYRQTISLDNGLTDVEIVDVCVDEEEENELPVEQIQWADSCVIVYSITDRESFKYATQLVTVLKTMQPSCAAHLIGNKLDLDHLRAVSFEEGLALATKNNVGFSEVSVTDNTPALYKAFESLLNDSRPSKQRKFSVSKMLGTLMGNNDKQVPLMQGTMVACCKHELHKSRVQKRRQGLLASVSL